MCVYRIMLKKYLYQQTKNWIIMMIFPMYPTYPLMKFVSFLNERSQWHIDRRTDNSDITKKIWEKNGPNVMTLCYGQIAI